MFKRFFGETEELQMNFLKRRVILSVALSVLFLIIGIFNNVFLPVGVSLSLYIWGWPCAKTLFGISTFGALFSSNFLFGVLLFTLSLLAIPVVGLVFMIIGILRFIYLLAKGHKNA